MDIGAISGSTRLLEAFEKLGTSEGAGLISSGPSPVPPDLARAFEQLMQEPASAPGKTDRDAHASSPVQYQYTAPLEDAPPVAQDMRVERKDGHTAAKLQSDEAPAFISPTELYHLQFQLAMLKLQSTTATQISQKTAQGLDSLLRNQS